MTKASPLDIQVGDMILFKTQNKTDKFQEVYEGPFEVLEAYDEYLEIKKDRRRMKVHKNLVKGVNNPTTIDLIKSSLSQIWNIFRSYYDF